jgi:large subunit ribosomal protein L6
MSRIAKQPIVVPSSVEVKITGQEVMAKGSKGQDKMSVHEMVSVKHEDGRLLISANDESKKAKALSGTMRALLANLVEGVEKGFEIKLTLVGVGYRAQANGKTLNLTLGLSHPVNFNVPEDVTVETPTVTEILVRGISKHMVGQVAANIRRYRPPEPYKGKGIRYADEVISLKETKKK